MLLVSRIVDVALLALVVILSSSDALFGFTSDDRSFAGAGTAALLLAFDRESRMFRSAPPGWP